MAYPEHLEILKQGVEAWNEWRKEHHDVTPDLASARLTGANLYMADLILAVLNGAHLKMAILSGANSSRQTLTGPTSARHALPRQTSRLR